MANSSKLASILHELREVLENTAEKDNIDPFCQKIASEYGVVGSIVDFLLEKKE
jgi:hypothetical protein